MKSSLLIAGLLLLAACDKDRLPDDLSQVEGTAVNEDANLAEENADAPPPPPAATNETAPAPVESNSAADPLAPTDSNPSFDCSSATNRVERHICDVPELGALDRRVAEAFDRALDEASTDQAERVRALGRQYLADRNRCRDDYCIRQAYRWYERDIYTAMGWQGPN